MRRASFAVGRSTRIRYLSRTCSTGVPPAPGGSRRIQVGRSPASRRAGGRAGCSRRAAGVARTGRQDSAKGPPDTRTAKATKPLSGPTDSLHDGAFVTRILWG